MDTVIRRLDAADRPAVGALLDAAVGAGFWGFDPPHLELACLAAERETRAIAGAVLARLEADDAPDVELALGAALTAEFTVGVGAERGAVKESAADDDPAATGARRTAPTAARLLVLHVRAIAVAPEVRRRGIARRLLAAVEREAAGRGAAAAYLFAWLPAGQPEPAAVPLYRAAGYLARPDIPDFFAAGSVATGALCPYCGPPPCRCTARPYVKALRPL